MAFTQLQNALLKASEAWLSPVQQAGYIARTEAIRAIIAEQTARFGEFKRRGKITTVEMAFIKGCELTVNDCSNDCVNNGEITEAATQEYDLTVCKEVEFKVPRKQFRTSIFDPDEVIAEQMLHASKALDEFWTQLVYTRLAAFAGVQAYDSDLWTLSGSPSGSQTLIQKSDMTVDIIPELLIAAHQNKMMSPFLLSGSLLYTPAWKAALNAANADGKGEALQWEAIRKYFDLSWADAVNAPAKKFYLIDRGSVAFVTKAWYETPEENKFDTRFAVASRNIPGVTYDVIHTETCLNDEIYDAFTVKTLGDIFLNPLPCENSRTGVYVFKQVSDESI